MRQKKHLKIMSGIWAMITGWLVLVMVLSPEAGISLTDRIIAIVNNEVITQTDLEREIQDEYLRLKAKYHGEELERYYHQKQREVLNQLIDNRLQLQEAEAKGFSVTQEELEAALRRTPLPPTQTEEEFRQQMLLKKLFDYEVRRNLLVEEEEARRYYEANITLFHKPPRYRLDQILLSGKEEFERERARKKAEALYAAWTPETPFTEFAAQHFVRIDQLGWVQENELLEPLGQAVKDLEPGRLSAPIETLLGYHLLLVEEIQHPEPFAFEEVEREIRNLLMQQQAEKAYRTWLAELKQQAFIEVKF